MMKHRQFTSLILFSILLISLSTITVSSSLNDNNFLERNNYQNSNISTNRISQSIPSLQEILWRNVRQVDQNYDKIADSLMTKINSGTILGNQNKKLILLFDDYKGIPDVLPLDIPILNSYSSIPAIEIETSISNLGKLAQISNLAAIEENHPLTKYLAYSASQIGVRPNLWDQGFTGSSDLSVAVVDSGIDYTHPAFAGRIKATWNAQNNNATSVADNDGHGTHVAGIIAGQGETTQTFSQTTRGLLPAGNGNFFADLLWANNNETNSISAGMDWGAVGADNPGNSAFLALIEFQGTTPVVACGSCIVTSTTGLIQTTFSNIPPGDYYIGFGNDAGAGNTFYEGWASIPQDNEIPSQQNEDGYPFHQGMASNTNIVSVKVLDSVNGGDSNDFFNAIDWIIDNKLTYNITVVNFSLGVSNEKVASIDLAIASLVSEGMIPVIAAGNDGVNSGGIFSPGSAREGITVGAVNRVNEVAYYSSNGDPAINAASIKPDLLAPGGSVSLPAQGWDTSYAEGLGLIVSADSNFVGFNKVADDYTGLQGTSMAAPHVSGVALLLAQQIQETKGWTWSTQDVYRIKQALLAGTFEVGNIGSNGGEGFPTQGIPDQTPAITRNSKDFVEGWGALNAEAAMGALANDIIINSKINLEMSHENPFGKKVQAWTLNVLADIAYNYSATVPAGADIDLLVFDTSASSFGELSLIYSSTNGKGINEQITIQEATAKELLVVVKMIDSDNSGDNISVSMDNPNFIPFVELISPINGTFVNTPNVPITFTSPTNEVEAFIDGTSKGMFNSGDRILSITEGSHILVVVETNSNTGKFFSVQANFTVDLKLPTLSSDINLLSGLSIEDPVLVNFTTSDNFGVASVEIQVDGIPGENVDPNLGSITIDPSNFSPGLHTVSIIAFDLAGNSVSESTTITFTNSVFVNKQTDQTSELGDEFSITWIAGSNNPDRFEIYWDTNLIDSGIWNGLAIIYTVSNNLLTLGDHTLRIVLSSTNGKEASDELIVSIIDTTLPEVADIQSDTLDATNEQTIDFSVFELSPQSIEIRENGSLLREVNPWDGNIGETFFTFSGTPNTVSIIEIIVSDLSNNRFSELYIFEWKDLTLPLIDQPNDLEFLIGGATTPIEWSWQEKFVNSVVVFLDDNEILNKQLPDAALINSLSISLDTLNSLEIGNHRFKIEITDAGGNSQLDIVNVFINADQGNNENNKSDGGFLPWAFGVFLMTILSLPLIRKMKNFKRNN